MEEISDEDIGIILVCVQYYVDLNENANANVTSEEENEEMCRQEEGKVQLKIISLSFRK